MQTTFRHSETAQIKYLSSEISNFGEKGKRIFFGESSVELSLCYVM